MEIENLPLTSKKDRQKIIDVWFDNRYGTPELTESGIKELRQLYEKQTDKRKNKYYIIEKVKDLWHIMNKYLHLNIL